MGNTILWGSLGVVGIVALVFVLKWLDKLLLRAEAKGWIYYRKKSAGGIASNVLGSAMTELDRITRPSAEYRMQAEDPVLEEDEKDGE
jgi:hypothetical protein